MDIKQKNIVLSVFKQRHGDLPAAFITAPGRINLIGEHTDYSEGFVLPVAINRSITIAFSPRTDDVVRLYSIDFDEDFELSLDHIYRDIGGWKDYLMGIVWSLMDSGYQLTGWEGVVVGDIPIGAGLSSSAAFEVAIGKTFSLTSNLNLSPTQLALICKKAEVDWVGVNVGIMDQLISAAGKEKHAVLIDCKTLDFDYVPIPVKISFVVLDTMTRRELTQSEYNNRHEEVKAASELLGIPNLRAATLSILNENSTKLPPDLYQRAKHVVSENQRVIDFSNAMRNGDLSRMGQLINDSHASLRDDFMVSSPELNLIVELAQKHPDCLGARMTGAGFGGCALALLNIDDVDQFARHIHQEYHKITGLQPHIFKVDSANGVQSYTTEELLNYKTIS